MSTGGSDDGSAIAATIALSFRAVSTDRLKRRGEMQVFAARTSDEMNSSVVESNQEEEDVSSAPPLDMQLGTLVCMSPNSFQERDSKDDWVVLYIDQDMLICECTAKGGKQEGTSDPLGSEGASQLLLWSRES